MTVTSSGPLSAVDALTVLLTAESLLVAVVGIAVSFGITEGSRVRWFPVPLKALGMAATALIAVAAIGAGFAWADLFHHGSQVDSSQTVIAVAIIATIVGEPVLAFFLALGLWIDR